MLVRTLFERPAPIVRGAATRNGDIFAATRARCRTRVWFRRRFVERITIPECAALGRAARRYYQRVFVHQLRLAGCSVALRLRFPTEEAQPFRPPYRKVRYRKG